jgi:predicted nucleic acid-binding Zn ribbon protein
LLKQAPGALARLREGTERAERTLAALRRLLPPEVAEQTWGASLKEGTLTVLVRSAAWGTRLRYLAPRLTGPLAAELALPIERVKVKVRGPRGGAG